MKNLLLILFCFAFNFIQAQKHSEHIIKIGKTPVTIQQTDYGNKPEFLFFNMHENENTSVLAAKPALGKGGSYRLIVLKHSGKRNLEFSKKDKTYQVDPNRIYTKTGARLTVERNSKSVSNYAVKSALRFSRKIKKKYIHKAKYVVALHNNTPDNYSVLGYLPGGVDAPDVEDVFVDENNDHDNFFYTTDRNFHEFAKSKGFNTVLQKPGLVRDDGSLSVYCGIKGLLYINIEAEHGHTEMQQKMTELVIEYLDRM